MWTNSDLLARSISEDPEHFIELAYKLRNKTLSRECATHIAGQMNFHEPEPHGPFLYDGSVSCISNPKILEVLKIMRDGVTSLFIQTQMNVLVSCVEDPDYLKILSTPIPRDITIPVYYRGLSRDHRL